MTPMCHRTDRGRENHTSYRCNEHGHSKHELSTYDRQSNVIVIPKYLMCHPPALFTRDVIAALYTNRSASQTPTYCHPDAQLLLELSWLVAVVFVPATTHANPLCSFGSNLSCGISSSTSVSGSRRTVKNAYVVLCCVVLCCVVMCCLHVSVRVCGQSMVQ